MSDRAIHENGISIKLCELCNSNKEFLTKFLRLFDNIPKKYVEENHIGVDYIYFSGNHETGNGKPDITIRFEDGDFFYIEVKTNANTTFQENQLECYETLIKKKGQSPKNSFAFLIDLIHVEKYKELFNNNNFNEYNYVTWNKVYNLIKTELADLDFKKRLQIFKEELEHNVDGLNEYSNDVELTKGEYMLLFKPKKLKQCYDFLQNLKAYAQKFNFTVKHTLNSNLLNDGNQKQDILFTFKLDESLTTDWLPNLGYYVILTKGLEDSDETIDFNKSIFIGFNISVLDDNNFVEKTNDEIDKRDYFFSISIESDLLDINSIRTDDKDSSNEMMHNSEGKVRYCKDNSNWCYFPLIDKLERKNYFNIDTFNKIFNEIVPKRLNYIFNNYLPNDTRRLNYIIKKPKSKEKK